MDVRLDEITKDNYRAVTDLEVTPEQAAYTVSNSLALVETIVYAGRIPLAIVDTQQQTVVGLLVYGLEEVTGRWWLHHLMIDACYQRQGYGRSAVEQLVTRLEQQAAARHLYAQYDVTNTAAEQFGTRLDFRIADDTQDEYIVVARPIPARAPLRPRITLRDITLQNARACLRLNIAAGQARFVASNAESLVQSKFEPYWLTKAIYNDNLMVGFVMYGHDPEFGWGVLRLMIDAAHQGRGYGRAAMELVLNHIQAEGGTSMGVSYEADNTVAQRLYHSLGFVETEEQPFGEPFAVLRFPKAAP